MTFVSTLPLDNKYFVMLDCKLMWSWVVPFDMVGIIVADRCS